MKVAVCLKRVPDTTTKIRMGGDGKSIDPAGVEWIISPYDEIALEAAIQLKEAGKADSVVAICLGPKEATKDVRTALAMGADEGVLLVDDGNPRDGLSIAKALAGAVNESGADLVIFGWKAIDTDRAAVPHLLANEMDRPCITFVTKFEVEDGKVTAHREIEGATEIVEASLPCVLTAQKGLAEPRYASLKGIMKAKKKPLAESPAPEAASTVRTVSLELPPVRPEGRIVGEGADAVPALIQALQDEAKLL
ncbi:MAG: electron transfer flavoprotein subunit beta/FixA family protein [Planctomycetota bacterium]|jgi:electron transfer flavoprotein beta subunit